MYSKYGARKALWIIAAFVIGVLVSGIAFYFFPIGFSGASEQNNTVVSNPAGTNLIANVVSKTSPAVVMVRTQVRSESSENPFFNDPFFRQFFGNRWETQPRYSEGMGSGFIISKDGYILTNEHVINGASKIDIYMSGSEDPIPAKLVGSDYELDLAVLKINLNRDLPYLELGDSDAVRVGEWAIAIGNPQGLDHTVTVGVISAKGRPITVGNRQYKNLLQTDASINPGNSGGPLLNTAGKVVGINTAVSSSAQGIGFAIPTSTVKPVLDTLIKNGKITRPWLGVYIQSMSKEIAQRYGLSIDTGALVTSVVEGGPAHKAGIIQGDIVVEINNNKVASADDLTSAMSKIKPGEKIPLVVNRSGKNINFTVTIEERK